MIFIKQKADSTNCGKILFSFLLSCICLFPSSMFGEDNFSWKKIEVDTGKADWCSIATSSDGTKIVAAPKSGSISISKDGGATWSQHEPDGSASARDWEHVSISADGSKILAASRNEVFLSSDEGLSWEMCQQAGMEYCNYIFSVSISGDAAKIAIASSEGIYISSDEGKNWEKHEPAGVDIKKCWLSIAFSSNGEIIIAAAANDFVYVSPDGGSSWMQCDPANQGLIKTWSSVAISPDGAKMVACASNDFVYASSDVGKNWFKCEPAGEGSPRDWSSVSISENGFKIVVAGSDDFIYVSSDAGSTWKKSETSGTPSKSISVTTSADCNKIYAVAEDSYISASPDSGTNWITCKPKISEKRYLRPISISSDGKITSGSLRSNIYSSDGTAICANLTPNDSKIVPEWSVAISSDGEKMAAAAYMGENPEDYIYTSDDGGTSWIRRESAGLKKWNAIDISADGAVICASAIEDFIYISSDGGTIWEKCVPAETNIPLTYNSLSISGNGSKIAAASSDNCIYLSSDTGITWTKCDPDGEGIQKSWNSVSISGDGTNIIAAASYDFIYVSDDGGISWTKCDPSGTRLPKNWISVSISGDGAKIAASSFSDNTVYVSLDGGTSWEKTSPSKTETKEKEYFYSLAFSADGKTLAVSDAYDMYCGTLGHTVTFDLAGKGIRTGGGGLVQKILDGDAAFAPEVLANTGWIFYDWDLTFDNISSDLIITAQYRVETYAVIFTSGSNGNLQGQIKQTVEYGKDCTEVVALPDTGYKFANWTVEEKLTYSTDNPLIVTNVTTDMLITANFAVNIVSIVSDFDKINVPEGSTSSFGIKLSAQPAEDTTVTFAKTSGDSDINIASASSVIFTSSNWDTYQTVTLEATEDSDLENGTATIKCYSEGIADKNISVTEIDDDCILTISKDGNGTTAPSGELVVEKESTVEINALADPGYHFSEWLIKDGTPIISNIGSSETSIFISGDAEICAVFKINSCNVNFVAGANGRLQGQLKQTVEYGKDCTEVVALPDTGYKFANWTVEEKLTYSTDNPLAVTNVTTDMLITANFAVNIVSIVSDFDKINVPEGSTSSFGIKLSAQPAKDTTVMFAKTSDDSDVNIASASSVIFTSSNWDTYQNVELAAAEDSDLENGTATIKCYSDGIADKYIPVTEIDNDCLLTISNDGNGTTAPSGELVVEKESTVEINALADPGYHFSEWLIKNGTPIISNIGSSETSIFISGDAQICAVFKINSCTVNFIAGANGNLQGQIKQTVEYGKDCTEVVALPDTGYKFANWTVEEKLTYSTDNPLTVTNVTTDILITANFAANIFSIVTDLDKINVPEGSTSSFGIKLSAQPAEDTTITFAKTSGDSDINIASASSVIFTSSNWDTYQTVTLEATEDSDLENGTAMIKCYSDGIADKNISVTEIDDDCILTISNDGNGTTAPSGELVVEKESTVEINAVADPGYHFSEWLIKDGTPIISNISSSETNIFISGDAEVYAVFKINSCTVNFVADANGSIEGQTKQTVEYGKDCTEVIALPDTGYKFANWTVEEKLTYSTDNPLAVTNVTTDMLITANFARNLYIDDRTKICLSLNNLPKGANLLISPTKMWTKDSIRISHGSLKGFSFDDKFDPPAKDIQISVDGEVFITSPEKGVWRGAENRWDYRSAKGVEPRISLQLDFSDVDNPFWSFYACDGVFTSIDNSDGVDVRIAIDDVTCIGNYNMIEKGIFRFRSDKNTFENLDTVLAPMEGFSVARLNGRYDTSRDEFTLFVWNAKYDCKPFECLVERSQIAIDNRDFIFTPSEFKKNTKNLVYNKPDEGVRIILSPETEKWRLRLLKVGTEGISPANGLIFRLCLGSYEGAILCNPSSRIRMTYRQE